MLRLALAWLHLLALGIGLGSVWTRGRVLSGPLDQTRLRLAFAADSWWGLAAGLWIITGLWRLFASMEKTTSYYVANHAFRTKMGLLGLILILELWPMITLIRWRLAAARGTPPSDSVAARRIAMISYVEVALVVGMVGAAVAMARGYGA